MTDEQTPPVNTINEFIVTAGQNLPNHSTSLAGFPKFIRTAILPMCRTKQAAYRLAAWLLVMAESLPDEPGNHSFDEVQEAIRNT